MGFDLDTYAGRAEAFIGDLDREYHLHHSGQKPDFEVEEVYERHLGLFEREVVDRLRELASHAGDGDAGRRAAYLLEFAVGGYLGRASAAEDAALAGKEAELELDVGGETIGYRMAPVVQANEADAERRREIERQRLALLEEHLNPLHLAVLRRSHELVVELGWPSYTDACIELSGIDLPALARQTAEFLAATEEVYRGVVSTEMDQVLGFGLEEASRADLARFLRAPGLDEAFPADRLIPSFAETVAEMGLSLESQPNIRLDTEQRPTKSPRAYCAPVRVPDEVYLVVPRVGGREDYAALFHEGGHAQHYANAEPTLAAEYRYLGDNSVTESFAFLLEHVTEDPGWLAERLGADPDPVTAHDRAVLLFFLRRYAAKLGYELELHAADPDLETMPGVYAQRVGAVVGMDWDSASWLADVDSGFYVAGYLRAWALEERWRAHLRERFGEAWFKRAEAGEWLRGLWRQGQRLRGDELLAEMVGEELRFDALAASFA
jgi:hypothetical protein